MLKLLKIGRHKIEDNIKEFAFDGCHKIYLVSEKSEKEEMKKNKGWEDSDFHKMTNTNLEECYYNSCPLRFIDMGESRGFKTIVPQCATKVSFFYEDTQTKVREKHTIDFNKDTIIKEIL